MPTTKSVEPLRIPGDVDELRADLEVRRVELLTLYEHDMHVGQDTADESADDSIDRANNSFNRELMFSLSDTERRMLILVEEACDRMDKGEYGQCDHCGETIGRARLKAVPWARYCIGCQESEERGSLDR